MRGFFYRVEKKATPEGVFFVTWFFRSHNARVNFGRIGKERKYFCVFYIFIPIWKKSTPHLSKIFQVFILNRYMYLVNKWLFVCFFVYFF